MLTFHSNLQTQKKNHAKGLFLYSFHEFRLLFPDTFFEFLKIRENLIFAKKLSEKDYKELFHRGMFLYASPNTYVEHIKLSLLQDCYQAIGQHSVLFIILDTGSSLSVYDDEFGSTKRPLEPLMVVECIMRSGSQLTFLHNQSLTSNGKYDALRSFYLDEKSSLNGKFLFSGGSDLQYHLRFFLHGKNAVANIKGFYALDEFRGLSLKTEQYHFASDSISSLAINGIVSDAASINFIGNIFVAKDVQGVQSEQKNKTILLSNQASMVSAPNIEVLSNNVLCKHGSAVGYFDENQLFYLMSRGLSLSQAKSKLAEGFFDFLFQSFNNQYQEKQFLKNMRDKVRRML